jgi:hypothetical protein
MTAEIVRREESMQRVILILAGVLAVSLVRAEERVPSAERGRENLLTVSYVQASMTRSAYDDVWKQWGLEKKPAGADYDRLYRERYGLHAAPYPNGGLPMGLKESPYLGFLGAGITQDCLICHGGSIAGKSYIGLGNSTLDYESFSTEMLAASGTKPRLRFTTSHVRGTTEAGTMAVYLFGMRNPDLTVKAWEDLGMHDDMCEDTPAWWLLKKKKTMYWTGEGDQRSVRSLMQFMLSPLNGPDAFVKAEPDFADIRAFLLSLEAPKYPLPIDEKLAARGKDLFENTCSRCHGTYGANWTYPNKIIPVDEIGTDRRRYDGFAPGFGELYNRSWFAKEKSSWFTDNYRGRRTAGYQPPPLDGIWATAPYFHNGSAPTVYHVLNSKARPKVFTRSYKTDLADYDTKRLGWKITELPTSPNVKEMSPLEARKIYDTTQPGRGNGGHIYGDKLTDDERFAIIEYLKTL